MKSKRRLDLATLPPSRKKRRLNDYDKGCGSVSASERQWLSDSHGALDADSEGLHITLRKETFDFLQMILLCINVQLSRLATSVTSESSLAGQKVVPFRDCKSIRNLSQKKVTLKNTALKDNIYTNPTCLCLESRIQQINFGGTGVLGTKINKLWTRLESIPTTRASIESWSETIQGMKDQETIHEVFSPPLRHGTFLYIEYGLSQLTDDRQPPRLDIYQAHRSMHSTMLIPTRKLYAGALKRSGNASRKPTYVKSQSDGPICLCVTEEHVQECSCRLARISQNLLRLKLIRHAPMDLMS